MITTKKQAKKLGFSQTLDLKGQLAEEYLHKRYHTKIKDRIIDSFYYGFFLTGVFVVLSFIYINLFAYTFANEEKHIIDQKIEKFCKIDGERFDLEDYVNKCIKFGKAVTRFETGGICKNKKNNNCFNFKAISKQNQEGFKINGLDKSGFTIFADRTQSVKYFTYVFYKYHYRKNTSQFVCGGTYKNLQGQTVSFGGWTATKEDCNNYIWYINNFNF